MSKMWALPDDLRVLGRVAVLIGGWSNERSVSLVSGQAVHQACLALGLQADALDVVSMAQLRAIDFRRYDRVFIALHGDDGEGGLVQAWLTALGIPFTGSDMAASSVCMDKTMTKAVCAMHGIPCLPQVPITTALPELSFPYPVCVKPNREGSSLGVVRVDSDAALPDAIAAARTYGHDCYIEPWVSGREMTVGLLLGQALPVIEIVVEDGFYDYQHKYKSNKVRYEVPCQLAEAQQQQLQAWAVKAFDVLGCRGWARADFIADAQGQFWCLEMNTVPGMTPKSLVPQAAQAVGIDFNTLVGLILTETLATTPPQTAAQKLGDTVQ